MRLFLLIILSMAMVNVYAQSPQLSVSRESISTSVANGGTTTQTFTVTNTGNRDLTWDLKTQGIPIEFIKPAFGDWTQASKQDRITPSVWLTRQNTQGLFNIRSQNAYNSTAPAGTQWAFGKSADLVPADYATWQTAVNGDPQSMIDNVMSMRTVAENRFFDITFHSFAGSNTGGAFYYTRVEYNLPWVAADFTDGTLLPGQSKTITLTFDATKIVGGSAGGFVVIESNDPQQQEKKIGLSLVVNAGGAAEIDAVTSKDLGEGYANFANEKSITLNNLGTGLLTISDAVSSNPAFLVQATNFSITPGQGLDFRIMFMPTTAGPFTGNITLTTNDSDEPTFVIAVTANAIAAPVSAVSASTVSATLASGSTSSQSFVLSNTGGTDLTYNISFNLGRSTPVAFSKANYADPTLPENQDRVSADVLLTRGDRQGLYNIGTETSYSASTSPMNTKWAATSTATATSYTNWRNAMESDPREMINQVTSMHITSENRFFDVTLKQWTCCENGGGFTYERTEVYNFLTASTSGGTIAAGTNEQFDLSFNAAGLPAGTYNGTFKIKTNDPAVPTRNIPVTFIVTGAPQIRFHEASLSFDNIALGLISRQKIRVINDGATALNISSITYSESDFTTYEATGTIAPFSYGIIEVAFRPTAVKSYAGNVTFTTNDPANPTITLAYTGAGVAPGEINVVTEAMNASVSTGETATRTITIENSGTGEIHWSAALQNNNPLVTFSKEDHADYKLAENQDRIAPSVWITRMDEGGLFNIAQEQNYTEDVSPLGTTWQFGSTFTADLSDYTDWRNAIDSDPLKAVGDVYSLHAANEYYDIVVRGWTSNANGGGFSYERRKAAGWIKLDMNSGTILPGESAEITVTYDPSDYATSQQNGVLVITSDDPNEGTIEVPVSITITGAAEITTAVTELDFASVGTGFTKTLPVKVANTGTHELTISSITSSDAAFSAAPANITIPVSGSTIVNVKFSPSSVQSYTGEIVFNSNADNESALTIEVTGIGIAVPDIAVTPGEIIHKTTATTIFNGTIEIKNSGAANLEWTSGQISVFPIDYVLTNLNAGFSSITALIPSKYEFEYDGGNTSISDGGGDMYDGGNIINSNLATEIPYSDDAIIAGDGVFGSGTKYFTRHFDGLFVMVADLNNVSSFSITGNNGADGGGTTDVALLTKVQGGTEYTGYLRRVYAAGDPSINQLMIVEKDAAITHNYATNTDNTFQEIANTENVKRVYYLLFSSQGGGFINDASAQSIMEEFLKVISGEDGVIAEWLTLDNYSGSVAPGATQSVQYTIDLTSFPDANYITQIPIMSNDPDEAFVKIPVHVNIGSVIIGSEIDDIIVNEGFGTKVVDFSNTFIDGNNDALTYAVGSNLQVVTGSITGTSLTLTGVGTGSSIISIRAEDANHNVAYEDFNFRINDVPSVATALADVSLTYGFASKTVEASEVFVDTDEDDVVTLSVASSNAAVVSVALVDGIITITEGTVGTSTITLTANDGVGGISTETFVVTVNKATATLALANTTATFDGTVKAVTPTTTPVNLVVVLSYSQNGAAVTSPVNAGTYDVTATINDANYQGTKTGTLTINKAAQTITFANIAGVMNSNAPFTLTATSSAGLPVRFTKVSGPITVSGNTVTLTGDVGDASVEATQAGNTNYTAAVAVVKSFTIAQDPILSVDNAFTAHVQAYPVPAKDYLNVSVGTYTIKSIVLSDAFGRTVYSAEPNRSEHTISTGNYAQGVYILQVKTEKGLVSRRVSVAK